MNDKCLADFFNTALGSRNVHATYSYADIVYALLGNVLTNGSVISDFKHLKEIYHGQEFDKIPSHDTFEYVCQELKTDNIIITAKSGIKHEFNYCDKMNATLLALAVKTGQLKAGQNNYTLDIDNVILENEKQDARYTFKKMKGYHPILGFIGRLPVHIENHNGNTPAAYQQKEMLERFFTNATKYGIEITNFRADSATYQKDVIDLVKAHVTNFYIRADASANFNRECGAVKKWNKIIINNVVKEVASIEYKPFSGEDAYRVVVTRTERKDKQIDLESGTAYKYYGIITSDREKDDKGVIEFYNQRGDDENSNRYMLNDFNLHHLPFPDLNTNTVYIYLMGMCATLFEWIKIILVKNKVKGIELSMRVKAICFGYICVAARFLKHARKKILKFYSKIKYSKLTI